MSVPNLSYLRRFFLPELTNSVCSISFNIFGDTKNERCLPCTKQQFFDSGYQIIKQKSADVTSGNQACRLAPPNTQIDEMAV